MDEVIPKDRVVGKTAHEQNISAVIQLGELVKTTLGPRGMDKMLINRGGRITITNDGVTILQDMQIGQPAAKLIAEIAQTQEKEIGDGTTTVAMLTGKLLENAKKLLDRGIHATTIVRGYDIAAKFALEEIKKLGITTKDNKIMKQIAMTAMTGKGAEGNREQLAEIIISALDKIKQGKDIDKNNIRVSGIKGGSSEDTELIDGVVLDKQIQMEGMVRNVEDAKILLIDFDLELKPPVMDAQIQVRNPQELQSFMDNEKQTLQKWATNIKNSGANVIFCQRGIADQILYHLSRTGIMAIRRVNKYDMEDLARATGGQIISDPEEIEESVFGKAGTVEEIKRSDNYRVLIKNCQNAKMNTILVGGSTDYMVQEISRAISDGLGDVIAVIKDEMAVPGGGCVEMELSRLLKKHAIKHKGREQLAIKEFANALEFIPETLAANAGLDSINILAELEQRHEKGEMVGLNLFEDKITDTFKDGIIEPMKIKTQAIKSAVETAMMILRIDDIILAAEEPQ